MIAGAFSWLGAISRWVGDLVELLNRWAGNWWFLAVVLVIALLDAVIPVVPSETAMIIAGVAVSTGSAPYGLLPLMLCGAAGAFLGDNISYAIGHRFSGWIERRADRKPKFRERLEKARRQIATRGGPLLITARFLPGGRTFVTLSSGATRQPRLWFAGWDAGAATIWAAYAAGLAYLVGRPLEHHQGLALWTAFGVSMAINVVIELVRRRRSRTADADRRPLAPGPD